MACVYYTFSVTESERIGMNRHIYRLVDAILAAITIVSCNDARRIGALGCADGVGAADAF